MKIRTSLLLLCAFFVVSITGTGIIMFHTLKQITTGFDDTVVANQMIKDLFELNILTLEYSIHHEERMAQQWSMKLKTLGATIEQTNPHLERPEEVAIISAIKTNYDTLNDLFSKLQNSAATLKKLQEEEVSPQRAEIAKELERRLLASVLIKSQMMTAGALRLFEFTKKEMLRLESRTDRALLFGIVGLVLFLSLVSVMIIRSITGPLRELTQSAKIFGAGDLNHRTPVKTENEIGQLGKAFNRMARDLKATTVSRNHLRQEVNEKIRVAKNLRKTKNELKALFDGITDPLMMLTEKGAVETMNRAAEEYYGVRLETAAGNICYTALRNRTEPCPHCGILPVISNENYAPFERNGIIRSDRLERVSLYPVQTKKKEKTFAIVHISDITDQKMAQQRALQNEKLLSMSFLISGIAHEMNNPNSFISLNTPILREYLQEIMPVVDAYAENRKDFEPCDMAYTDFREDLFKLIGNIENGSRRINRTVSRLKALVTHEEDLHIEEARLGEVVESALELCRARASALSKTLEVDLPTDFPVIRTDQVILEQVLSNIIVNAVQAAEQDVVRVGICVFSGEERGARCVIEISDDGCGMTEEVKNRVFEPFFTGKPAGDGSGLGLYLCQSFMGALGGHMEVESEPGKGSLFRIVLYQ